MAMSLPAESGPIGELNTTPLIDVMLVLLVMFILSIPAAMNEIPFNLPQDSGTLTPTQILPQNLISLSSTSAISWNGQTVSEDQLVTLLKAAALRRPEPLIRFEPEAGAPYGAALRTLSLIRASDPATFAFSGNEKYARFGKVEPKTR
jgi:biopolymer transport protein ExbD